MYTTKDHCGVTKFEWLGSKLQPFEEVCSNKSGTHLLIRLCYINSIPKMCLLKWDLKFYLQKNNYFPNFHILLLILQWLAICHLEQCFSNPSRMTTDKISPNEKVIRNFPWPVCVVWCVGCVWVHVHTCVCDCKFWSWKRRYYITFFCNVWIHNLL